MEIFVNKIDESMWKRDKLGKTLKSFGHFDTIC